MSSIDSTFQYTSWVMSWFESNFPARHWLYQKTLQPIAQKRLTKSNRMGHRPNHNDIGIDILNLGHNWVMSRFESILFLVPWVDLNQKSGKLFESWVDLNQKSGKPLSRESIWIEIMESHLSRESIWIKFRKPFWIVSWFESILGKPLWVMRWVRIKTFCDWVESNRNKNLSRTNVW